MAIPDEKPSATNDTPLVSPFPDLGGLYLLIAGIVLGVLLGPAVLGRLAPAVYEDAFVGGAEQRVVLEDNQATLEKQAQTLEEIGVTDVAIPEQILQAQQQEVVLRAQLQKAQQDHLTTLEGWATSLMLAVIAVMIIESLRSPDVKDPNTDGRLVVSPATGRLITARYALGALWITLVLAQPALLMGLPVLFAGLLVLVAVGAALVPLGPSRGSASG